MRAWNRCGGLEGFVGKTLAYDALCEISILFEDGRCFGLRGGRRCQHPFIACLPCNVEHSLLLDLWAS